MWNFLKSPRPRKFSWLAWCSFSVRASNRLHFSTTFRLGCGGGLILAEEGVPDSTTRGTSMGPGSSWACASCPGPTTHRLSGSHELYSMLPVAFRHDAASLALSGSRFAVRSWSGCSQILMLSQKPFNCAMVDIATVALWPLLLLQLACCHHWAQHQGPN